MINKNIVIALEAHHGYTIEENNGLFQAISETYIPLLNMLRSFEHEMLRVQIALVLSPPLCTLLEDKSVQRHYVEWLDKRIELGNREQERLRAFPALLNNAVFCLEKAKQDKIDFTETYNRNLVKHFADFARKGYVELLATTGTHIFLPHYADMPDVINAQIEIGLIAYKYFFGFPANGFWLPYMGYTQGIETALRLYGIDYTVLDAKSVLFSESIPTKGIFAPSRFGNSVVIFGSDSFNSLSNKNSFIRNSVYRNQNSDIGYELPAAVFDGLYKPSDRRRAATGYCYYCNSKTSPNPYADKNIYNPEKAVERAESDADAFLKEKNERLASAASQLNTHDVCLVCAFDASLFGVAWHEGMHWLESVIRKASSYGARVTGFSSLFGKNDLLTYQKIAPYPAAASGNGYGEDLLDSSNGWMMRHVRRASARMVDLAALFPDETGLKARLLNLGAKELMLAQSSEWAKMIHDGNNPEYAAKCFSDSIISFTRVFDSLGSNTVSTEWLTQKEREHPIFTWINYHVFSKKL